MPVEMRGQWFETRARCRACGVTLPDPPPPLDPSDQETTYDFRQSDVMVPTSLTGVLAQAGVAYRWEPDLVLAVPEAASRVVEEAFDDLEASTLAA